MHLNKARVEWEEMKNLQMERGTKEKRRGTYKRRVRESQVDAPNVEVFAEIGTKRSGQDLEEVAVGSDEEDAEEVPVKEGLPKRAKKQDWRTSPAPSNEASGLELPGVGKPSGSSQSSGVAED